MHSFSFFGSLLRGLPFPFATIPAQRQDELPRCLLKTAKDPEKHSSAYVQNDIQYPRKFIHPSVLFYKYFRVVIVVSRCARNAMQTSWVVTFGASLKTKGTMVVGK